MSLFMKTIMLPAKQGTRRSSSAPLMGRYLCHFPLGVGTITAPDGAPSPSTPPVMFQCHAEGCAPRLHREQTPASPGTQRGGERVRSPPSLLVRVPAPLPEEHSSSPAALGACGLTVSGVSGWNLLWLSIALQRKSIVQSLTGASALDPACNSPPQTRA